MKIERDDDSKKRHHAVASLQRTTSLVPGEEAMIGLTARALPALLLALASLLPARADSVSDFYKGRTVEVYVGYSTGGGYDIYARMLARHMGRFIPGNP